MIHRYIIEVTDEAKGFEEAIAKLDREWGIEELEPCDDAISRQAAIDAIAKIHPIDTEYDCTLYDKLDVRYVLMDLPSVTPQQETGKWIKEGEEEDVVGFRWTSRRCSKCGWTHCLVIPNNYCPNCGAKMEVEE